MRIYITVSYGLVRGRTKQYRYWQPAIYTITTNKDGLTKYKYIRHVGTARRSYNLAVKDAQKIAQENNYTYIDYARNNQQVGV